MPSRKSPYRIVHLSDLHLTADDDAERSEPKLFGKLTGMNASFRRLLDVPAVKHADLLLVTGDVTDRGDVGAWKVFWDAVQHARGRRVLVVPGNHDVCCLGARIPFDAVGYRKADMERALRGLALGGVQPKSYPWVERPDDRVAVIGLNSNNLGNFTAATNAMGDLGYYQLSSLASRLHVVRNVPVKIVALHHSPNIPAAEVEKKRGLRPMSALARVGHQIDTAQQDALQLLCVTHRVRLVAHGHLHRAEERRVAGIKIVGAPASTEPSANRDGKPALHFFAHTVLGDGGKVRTELKSVPLT